MINYRDEYKPELKRLHGGTAKMILNKGIGLGGYNGWTVHNHDGYYYMFSPNYIKGWLIPPCWLHKKMGMELYQGDVGWVVFLTDKMFETFNLVG
jgi:hypothetical protein